LPYCNVSPFHKVISFICFVLLVCGFSRNPKAVDSPPDVQPQKTTNTILARQFVKNTAHIPGGKYTSPYIIDAPNTEYILDGDIYAQRTAIAVRASKVVINLNGKTITYNNEAPGEGVLIDTYNHSDISIVNGKIFQGSALSEGDVYGSGNNPIKSVGVNRLQIANIYAKYGGRDVCGFSVRYAGHSLIEENTLEDLWEVGTMKNRHQVKSAILVGEDAIVRKNTIKNSRQAGIISSNNTEIYGNTISINSMVTNSAGIGGYKAKNVKVYDNTIVARGEHPTGIAYVSEGTDNIEIYNNRIDVQTTKLGDEYEAAGGNYAVGFRTTWGGNNINFYENTITVRTDSAFRGTRSATGAPVVVNAKGRGLMVAVNAGESATFQNNTITVLDKDGKGKAFGIACTGGNLGKMIFEGNVVTSNVLNVALGDEYGACGGHPLFIRNSFVKSGNFPAYQTVTSELGGYFDGTGRFVANVYTDGASQESININAKGQGKKSVYFGREVTAQLQKLSAGDTSGAGFKLLNNSDISEDIVKLDTEGKAKLFLYDYELHNRESNSSKTQKFDKNILQLIIGTKIFSTKPGAISLATESISPSKEHLVDLYQVDGSLSDFKVLVSL
jgi:hypothetical protein